jgi:hypothetical protein
MAIAASLSVTPAVPAHGAIVTAVYTVTGNAPGPVQSATVTGSATVGGQPFSVSTTVTMPGTDAQPVSYAVPSCPGLTFTVSPADPSGATFTAVVP